VATVFIIHGTGGNPEGNWFPWLKGKLSEKGHEVIVPKFPIHEKQFLDSWKREFENYKRKISKETILIGHSLGVAFILNILESISQKINASFLVAGFVGKIGISRFDELNKTFTQRKFNWERIRSNCNNFCVISSSDDPYVQLEKGEELAKNLHTKLTVLERAGHINSDSGYIEFDFLLKKINEIT
jgi:uncharacterized protein